MKIQKCRILLIAASIISLVLGIMIYSFLRSGTVYHSVLKRIGIVFPDYSKIDFPLGIFLRYYFTDMLWLFSLQTSILAITLPNMKKACRYSVELLFFAMIYELFQYVHIISGTGDIIDILMYIIATLSVVLLYNNLIISGGKK